MTLTTDPVEFRLYATDLTTQLSILPSMGGHIYFEMNDAGTGAIEIPLDSTSAALVEEGQFVACYYRGALRGGFFADNIAEKQANGGENGGRVMSITGRGAMGLLDRAIITDNGTTETTREFTAQAKGAILKTLLDEAMARGGLAVLTYDFTDTLDSSGAPWTDSENYKLNVGMSLLDLVRQFAHTGIDFDMELSGGSFILHAYLTPIGTDKSNTIYFRVGRNCEEVYSDLRGGKEVQNALRIKYKGGYINVEDAVSIAARGRREKLVSLEMAQSSASALTVGAAMLESSKDPKKQISVKITDSTGPRAFVDYDIGDTIGLDVLGVENAYRVLGIQCTFEKNLFADVIVDLNSLLYENDLRMAGDIDWLLDQWNTANDGNLIEVSYWAGIGDINIDTAQTFGRGLVKIGRDIYTAFDSDTYQKLMKYNLDTRTWTVLLDNTQIGLLAAAGTDLYYVTFAHLWKYDTLTDTQIEVGYVYDLDTPGASQISALAYDGSDYIYIAGNFDRAFSTYGDITGLEGLVRFSTVSPAWSTWGSGSGGAYLKVINKLLIVGTDIYAGGSFASINGVSASNIAVFDGSSWSALDAGLDAGVNALAIYGTNILAGGAFTGFISEWDGAAWTVLCGGLGDVVNDIAVYLTDVYAVGSFTDAGNFIAKYSGGAWYALLGGLNNTVYDIVLDDVNVIAKGAFTEADGKPALYIAEYFTDFQELLDYLSNNSTFNLGAAIHNATAADITDAGEIPFWDAITQRLRKITWGSIKTKLNLLYVSLTQTANRVLVSNGSGTVTTDADLEYDVTNNVLKVGGANWYDASPIANAIHVTKDGGGSTVAPFFSHSYVDGVNDFTGVPVFGGDRAAGSRATPTAILDGAGLVRLIGGGYDGTALSGTRAQVLLRAAGDWSGASHPTRIELWTTPVGSVTRALALTIGSDGSLKNGAGTAYPVGSGTTGQLVKWTGAGTIGDAAIIPPASNILTLTNAAASTLALNITAAKTLTLTAVDNYTLTVPASMITAGQNYANVFTTAQNINVSANPGLLVKGNTVDVLRVDTLNNNVQVNLLLIKSGTASGPQIFFGKGNTSGYYWQWSSNIYDTGDMVFYSYASGSTGVKLYIKQTGQFGVGNAFTSPAARLDISGTVDEIQLKVTGFTTQTLPVGYLIDNTAATNVIRNVLKIETQSTGTAAAGLGAGLLFSLETATASTMQSAARVAALWTDATNATRNAMYQEETYPAGTAVGHRGLWSQTAIAGSAFTIIANGTGDVTEIITIQYSCAEITGTYTGGGVVSLEPNASYDICSDGTSTLTITCAADGSVTIARSAGTDTFKFVGSMVWI